MARHLYLIAILILPSLAHAGGPAVDADFFERKIRPVLVEHCYKCHSAQAEQNRKLKADLRVDGRSFLLKGGSTGPSVVPGQPDRSILLHAIQYKDGLQMPPKTKLPDAVVADFAEWIRQGASWPDDKPAAPLATQSIDLQQVRRDHWAFQPLKPPALPAVRNAAWAKSPIDVFALAAMEAKNLAPVPPADRRTLLRRVHLDLVGLPPTPAEQHAFLADQNPDALAGVIDDLLARPQYGERWGRHWLDVVRYAESQGYERDEPKPHAWRFRDYVIRSFNDDKPFDRFLVEQLAGDELPDADGSTQIATTFLRLGTFDTIAADSRLAKYDHYDDIVGTTTAAFLGLTVRCARCHDHKFEPISQLDYYRTLAIFEPLGNPSEKAVAVGNEKERAAHDAAMRQFDEKFGHVRRRREALAEQVFARLLEEADYDAKAVSLDASHVAILRKPAADRTDAEIARLQKDKKRLDESLRRHASVGEKARLKVLDADWAAVEPHMPQPLLAYVFAEDAAKAPVTRLFLRGDPAKPADKVEPGIPAVLDDSPLPVAKPPHAKSTGRRLALANWMTTGGRHLVARVIVNRVWQYHFGVGLVPTSNDFGLNGTPPTHPELLDYLALDFVQSGWSIKRLHRQIMRSAVYRLSSAHDMNDADPDGALLWHWRTRRLESEAIRDSILAVAGRLNPEMYGPPVYPPLTNRVVVGDSAALDWGRSDERQSARRSVYVFNKRAIPLPELQVLGIPDSSTSAERRSVATTALQSLLLLNGKFANEQARHLAARLRAEAGDGEREQVHHLFLLTLCRPPKDAELHAALTFLAESKSAAADRKDAPDPLTSLCLVLLNTNEFVYLN